MFICTVSGRYIDILDPSEDKIFAEDIAYGLSNLCRFTGHTYRFYSVLEHTLIGHRELVRLGHAPDILLEFLLHDASEAYLGDISLPLKALLPQYKEVEGQFSHVIRGKWGLTGSPPPIVKKMDTLCAHAEWDALMPRPYADRDPDVARELSKCEFAKLQHNYVPESCDLIEEFHQSLASAQKGAAVI